MRLLFCHEEGAGRGGPGLNCDLMCGFLGHMVAVVELELLGAFGFYIFCSDFSHAIVPVVML